MEARLQTKVTRENQKEFYKSLYNKDKPLIDLASLSASQYVFADCRGYEYRQKYHDMNIVVLETLTTAQQFGLSRENFDYLIDNRAFNRIVWPKIKLQDCMVIFDHSPMLKYLTATEMVHTLESMAELYAPDKILLNSSLFFIDDERTVDRFYDLTRIRIKHYVVEIFYYDTQKTKLTMQFRAKKKL